MMSARGDSTQTAPKLRRAVGRAAAARRRADRDIERRSRAILDAVEDGILGLDLDGRTTFINKSGTRALGWPADEILRQSAHSILHPSHGDGSPYPVLTCAIHSSLTSESVVHVDDDCVWRKDGTQFTSEHTRRPLYDERGQLSGFVVVFRDTTVRMQAEKAKRALYEIAQASADAEDMHALYAGIHEIVADLMLAEDPCIALYDAAADSLTFPYCGDRHDRSASKPGLALTRHVLRTGRALHGTPEVVTDMSQRGEIDDVGPRSVDWLGVPLQQGGVTFGVLAVERGSPAQRFTPLDEQLLLSIAQHIAAAIERNRVRADMARQHEAMAHNEKLAAMGTLLAGVAHELSNPLTVVHGEASLLKRAVGEGALGMRADKIAAASGRCARIARNFLALVRQSPPERGRVLINEVVQEAVELLAYSLRVDGIDVVMELGSGVPALWADVHQLHQVLVNLVTNAHHAMLESARPRRLTIASRFEQGRVVVEVSDSGPGIPTSALSRLFEPFFTTKAEGQGTGLGLSLCRGIVEGHGGTIVASNRDPHGASFRIELPVQAADASAEVPSLRAAPAIVPGLRILVVDDEAAIADVLVEILSAHDVDVAHDGFEALQKIEERDYDFILADLKMPGMNGPALHSELARRHPRMLDRMALMTGDAMGSDIMAFLDRTGVPRLAKPFHIDEVLDLVERLQKQSNLRETLL
jgi:PAS domain S-box-containing protein